VSVRFVQPCHSLVCSVLTVDSTITVVTTITTTHMVTLITAFIQQCSKKTPIPISTATVCSCKNKYRNLNKRVQSVKKTIPLHVWHLLRKKHKVTYRPTKHDSSILTSVDRRYETPTANSIKGFHRVIVTAQYSVNLSYWNNVVKKHTEHIAMNCLVSYTRAIYDALYRYGLVVTWM
jgi:hypothetical protein